MENRNRRAISTTIAAVAIIVVIVVAAAGVVIATSGTHTTTITATGTTSTTSTSSSSQYKLALLVGGDTTDLGLNDQGVQVAQWIATTYGWTVSISQDVAYSDQNAVMTTYAAGRLQRNLDRRQPVHRQHRGSGSPVPERQVHHDTDLRRRQHHQERGSA